MNNEKIIEFLRDLKSQLEELKVNKNQKTLTDIREKIRMTIRRIYPNPEAVAHRLIPLSLTEYEGQLRQAIRAIEIIITEYEVFGFDDFTPQKEKVEKELKLGSEKLGISWRKKTTK